MKRTLLARLKTLEAGTLLTRDFKGRTYVVKVLDDGFESGFPGDRASRGRERVK